jgi:S-adenosylmethionine-diacylgycerolhomoserine-N-methlytransferase
LDSIQDIASYYKKQHKIYDATRSSFLFGRKELTKMVNQNLRESDKILEVGCGTGYILKRINVCLKHGIDASPEMLAIADRKLDSSAVLEHISFLDYQSNYKFDKIILSYFFTISLRNIDRYIEKLKSLLIDGGHVYIVDFHKYGNEYYRRYMNWHGIEMNPNLSRALEDNFQTNMLNLRKAYAGMWEYFIFHGKYNA